MTLDQLLELSPLAGAVALGVGWFVRTRYGPVLSARATRDADAIRDGTKE